MDEIDRQMFDSLAPEGAVPVEMIVVTTWIDPETGDQRWRSYVALGEQSTSASIGLLEMAKLDLIARSETGLPIRYAED